MEVQRGGERGPLMIPAGNPPENDADTKARLRAHLGAMRYEALVVEMNRLVDASDHATAYDIVYEAAFNAAATAALDGKRWGRIQEKAEHFGAAIDALRKTLRDDAGLSHEQARAFTAGAEADYAELLRIYGTESPRVQLGIASSKGGRPSGAGATIAELRELGLSRDNARALLDAAGLLGPTPRKR